MLTIHYSNRLEILVDQLAALIRQPCGTPFLPDTIVVQSNGMARWLALQLAQRLGICAQIRFPFPAVLIWELFRCLLPDVPNLSPFAPEVLTWRLMALLGEGMDAPGLAPLRAYCGDDDDCKRFDLAYRIATVFEQYLMYRPDWIRRWEAGEDDHWQAQLWRRLVTERNGHRVRLQEQLLSALTAETVAQARFPGRLALIGIPTMPPIYLEVFARLATFLDLHYFLLQPCRQMWREPGRSESGGQDETPHGTTDNRLLAAMGRLGGDFLGLVQAYPSQVTERFVEPGEDSLLHILQTDILNGQNRGTGHCPRRPLPTHDRSVQVHSCHSPRREVEVLHDQLLGLFETFPELRPADVLVMVPDIDAYAPFIEAVFATNSREQAIPFSIADRNRRLASSLINGFFALLDLPASRYDVNRLYTLLEIAALQRRFGLTEGDLPLIHRWLQETGVRWGIDHNSRAALGLPAVREHTWQAGLDRLFMGYALPGDQRQFFADILPYEAVEGAEAQVLGRLYTFTAAAFNLLRDLREVQSVGDWVTALNLLLEQFFAPDEDEEAEVQAIRAALQQLDQNARQAGFDTLVTLPVVVSCLRRTLETSEWSLRFLTGGVTFCALVPMRSIPFEVVCLLGMNFDAFPRLHRVPSFDLMAHEVRPGDRSRRDDDRYLFLESLLSARRCCYLSYVGRNRRDNSIMPPSVLVSELLDTLARGFYPATSPGGDVTTQVVTQHPLQAFSRRYFCGDTRLFSYAEALCEAGRLAGQTERQPGPLVTAGLDEPEEEWRTVTLRQLLAFFRHPTRYFLQQRLGIYLAEAAAILESREPFTLASLSRYTLRQEMLQRLLEGESPERIAVFVQAAGFLPHAQVGQAVFAREWPGIQRFVERLQQIFPPVNRRTLDVDLEVGPFRVTGQCADITPQGLVGYRLGTTQAHHRVEMWIRHLILNCLAPADVELQSRWLGEDKSFLLRPVATPLASMHDLLEWYWQGLQRPLPFFPDSALVYVEAQRQNKPDPLDRARTCWEGSEYYNGEAIDDYYRLAFRRHDPLDERFVGVARAVFMPLCEHLETL